MSPLQFQSLTWVYAYCSATIGLKLLMEYICFNPSPGFMPIVARYHSVPQGQQDSFNPSPGFMPIVAPRSPVPALFE